MKLSEINKYLIFETQMKGEKFSIFYYYRICLTMHFLKQFSKTHF